MVARVGERPVSGGGSSSDDVVVWGRGSHSRIKCPKEQSYYERVT